ncbi:Spy/CpxP family protein refolding chaperone [Seonamhaeicola sp. ML3]|uniref:Spy/CpxP family protein refolding chaperone n=1 Tax=Seonamhaeicola sp. ML3 TaxID=2937786 RepID=UPI00200BF0EF|nr:sensor of ECF-type sigma factor [Seonamhaeicola sp. ML3]
MKTYILPAILFLFALNMANAQPQDRERIEALKVSFITEQLDLTKKEAQAFWPIYNEFDKVNGEIRHQEMRTVRREIRENLNTMSEERASELLKKLENLESRIQKSRQEFMSKIQSVLPAKKIIKLKIAEDDFKRKMLNQWKTRRKGPEGKRQ